eukprot:Rhum_TRINITY_DN10478_c0_g1::Rhum_TRINITY_DN10478_c0_g1_i1::g.38670::m.38670
MTKHAKQCQALVAKLAASHTSCQNQDKKLTLEVQKNLTALVDLMRKDDPPVATVIKDGGVAVLEGALTHASKYPDPPAAVVSACTALLLLPAIHISPKSLRGIVSAISLGSAVYAKALAVILASLVQGHAADSSKVEHLAHAVMQIYGHAPSTYAGKALQCLLIMVHMSPELVPTLRTIGVMQRFLAQDPAEALLNEDHFVFAGPLFACVMNAETAPLLTRYMGYLIDMLGKSSDKQMAVLKLVTKYLHFVQGELPQVSITSLMDFVAQERTDAKVHAEALLLIRALLKNPERRLRVLHLQLMGFKKERTSVVELLNPLLCSSKADMQEFGLHVMREVAELKFSCANCSAPITDTRRYCAQSRASFCLRCATSVRESYVVESSDFRWAMAPLLAPALALLKDEGPALLQCAEPSTKVADLFAIFAQMYECFANCESMLDIIPVCSAVLQKVPSPPEGVWKDLAQNCLTVLRYAAAGDYSKPVGTAIVGVLAERLYDLDEVTVLQILASCIQHGAAAEVQKLLSTVLAKAYSVDAEVKALVAQVLRNGLRIIPEELTCTIVNGGLTRSLNAILESSTASLETQECAVSALARTVHLEQNTELLSPTLLLSAIQVFQRSQNRRSIAADTALLVRKICAPQPRSEALTTRRVVSAGGTPTHARGRRPSLSPRPSALQPVESCASTSGTLPGTPGTQTPLSARSAATVIKGGGAASAANLGSTSNSTFLSSPFPTNNTPHSPGGSESVSAFASKSLLDSTVLPPVENSRSAGEKAKMLFSDDGFEMLFLFTQFGDETKADALIALGGVASQGMQNMHVQQVPYLLNTVSELARDQRHSDVASTVYLAVAADPHMRKRFTQHALDAVIELSGSQNRETQMNAVNTLRHLRDGILSVKSEASIRVLVQYKSHREWACLEGEVTLLHLRTRISELFKGTPLEKGVGALRIGTKVLQSDAELEQHVNGGSGLRPVEVDEIDDPLAGSTNTNDSRTDSTGGGHSRSTGGSGSQARRRRRRKWKLGRELGSGAFGTVHHVVDEETTEQYAAKVFKLRAQGDSRQKMQESFMNEINLLRDLDHENIVRYIDTERKGDVGYIILEYVPGGSLLDFRKKFTSIPEQVARKFIAHALKGLEYLHRHNVIHLDVKSANLLVNTNGVVKVADFGCGVRFEVDGGKTSADGKATGTLPFMAPEVITRRVFSTACDIWSVGCTVIEMVCGGLIWCPRVSEAVAFVAMIKEDWNKGKTPINYLQKNQVSPLCLAFLKRCLQIDPSERSSAEELLTDPFCCTEDPLNHTMVSMADASMLDSNAMLPRVDGQDVTLLSFLDSIADMPHVDMTGKAPRDALGAGGAPPDATFATASYMTSAPPSGPPSVLMSTMIANTAVQHIDPAEETAKTLLATAVSTSASASASTSASASASDENETPEATPPPPRRAPSMPLSNLKTAAALLHMTGSPRIRSLAAELARASHESAGTPEQKAAAPEQKSAAAAEVEKAEKKEKRRSLTSEIRTGEAAATTTTRTPATATRTRPMRPAPKSSIAARREPWKDGTDGSWNKG